MEFDRLPMSSCAMSTTNRDSHELTKSIVAGTSIRQVKIWV